MKRDTVEKWMHLGEFLRRQWCAILFVACMVFACALCAGVALWIS